MFLSLCNTSPPHRCVISKPNSSKRTLQLNRPVILDQRVKCSSSYSHTGTGMWWRNKGREKNKKTPKNQTLLIFYSHANDWQLRWEFGKDLRRAMMLYGRMCLNHQWQTRASPSVRCKTQPCSSVLQNNLSRCWVSKVLKNKDWKIDTDRNMKVWKGAATKNEVRRGVENYITSLLGFFTHAVGHSQSLQVQRWSSPPKAMHLSFEGNTTLKDVNKTHPRRWFFIHCKAQLKTGNTTVFSQRNISVSHPSGCKTVF